MLNSCPESHCLPLLLLLLPRAASLIQKLYYCSVDKAIICELLMCSVLVALSFWALTRTLALANLYMFLAAVLWIQIDGAMDFFYTANDVCLPEVCIFNLDFVKIWIVRLLDLDFPCRTSLAKFELGALYRDLTSHIHTTAHTQVSWVLLLVDWVFAHTSQS